MALRTYGMVVLAVFGGLQVLHLSTNFALSTKAMGGQEPSLVVEQQQTCLGLGSEEDMDKLLSKYKQVYTVQPSKAAGTSFHQFSEDCMGESHWTTWGILNYRHELKEAIMDGLELPSLLNSQVWRTDSMCSLMKHATRESLIILNFREETGRLLSAIRQVIERKCYEEQHAGFAIVKDECQVQEKALVDIIQTREREIAGEISVLPCKVYECIKDNQPNLVVMDYKQSSRMQNLLAKHHCPQVMSQKKNIGSDKKKVSIILEGANNKGSLVPLNDWLSAKRELLELALQLKADRSCQANTKDLEDKLLTCPDKAVQISGRSYDNQKVDFPF